MKTSVVIGCLVAVACFAAVDSRAVSSRAARQVSFQTQSDEVKQDKDNKGQSNDVHYPVYEHPGYPWNYGHYPYQHGYPYHYPYPYQHPQVAPAHTVVAPAHTVVAPAHTVVAPAHTVVYPAVHPAVHAAPAPVHYPYPYNYPYHYPYGYNYWQYNCGYPGCETHVEQKENKPKEEAHNESGNDNDDKKSTISK